MTRIDDRAFVRAQYETEHNLAARKSAYADSPTEGPDPRELAFQAIAETSPRTIVEVGGGEGELAERIVRELGASLVGIDQSARMVEIQRAKGIDARVGDAVALPFADAEFDVAVAAWMLYHVADVDRALAELARVLRPGGRLVAVTNGRDHFRELRDLGGLGPLFREGVFSRENGEELLRRHFESVRRIDADGRVIMDDAVFRRFASSWEEYRALLDLPPFAEPLRIRRTPTIFVAETASA